MSERQYKLDVNIEENLHTPNMHTFTIEMDDGTEISGHFPNKEAFKEALELLMRELEGMPG